jgi:hypothetical protein
MNEKIVRALVDAGAVRHVRIIAEQRSFYVEIHTANGADAAQTQKGKVKTWSTLDAAAKWVRAMGIGEAKLMLTHWTPSQKRIPV